MHKYNRQETNTFSVGRKKKKDVIYYGNTEAERRVGRGRIMQAYYLKDNLQIALFSGIYIYDGMFTNFT